MVRTIDSKHFNDERATFVKSFNEVFLETITTKLSGGIKHKLIMTLQNMIYDAW